MRPNDDGCDARGMETEHGLGTAFDAPLFMFDMVVLCRLCRTIAGLASEQVGILPRCDTTGCVKLVCSG